MFNMKLEEKKMAKFSSGYLEIKKTKTVGREETCLVGNS